MNYAEIKTNDISNGIGIRLSLFVSGCTHHCKECFNKMTWDFNYGNYFTKEVEDYILNELDKPYISGLSLLGGEPLEYCNVEVLLPFIKRVKEKFPNKNIWCYTGYVWEKLFNTILTDDLQSTINYENRKELISLFDVLVDGPFILEKKDISLKFRGSSNQRIIDVKKTLNKGKIVLYDF